MLEIKPKEPMRGALIGPDDFSSLRFPLYGSIKKDGIRAIIPYRGEVLSKSYKPIRNRFIQECLVGKGLEGVEGELMVLDPLTNEYLPFNKILSAVNTYEGVPNFVLLAFDYYDNRNPADDFERRLCHLRGIRRKSGFVDTIPQTLLQTVEDLHLFVEEAKKAGEEGVMVRCPFSPYRPGKCSPLEHNLFKIKFWETDTAEIIGFEELLINDNVQRRDNFGRAVRSSHQENQIPGNTLGKLIVRNELGEFAVGSGFSDYQRITIWGNRNYFLGKKIQFKYIPKGMKCLPRSPIFLKLI